MKRFYDLIRAPWLLPIVALATLTRFSFIGKAAIWHDEGFTAMLTARGWAAIWAGSARDVHPPLYYELLHAWRSIFGDSAIVLRSMSAVAGVAAVVLGVWLVRLIATRRAAILAGIFLALSPILVRYSQEARMYGLLSCFVIGATIALVYHIQHPGNKKYLIYYALLMAVGFYTHYFTALVVLVHWLWLLMQWDRHKHKWYNQAVLQPYWLIANAAIVILYLPWLGNLLAQFTRGQGVGWIPKATFYTLPSALWQFMTFNDGRALWLAYWIPLVLIGVVTYLLIKKDGSKHKYNWLICLYTLVPILATLAVSFVKPLFIERYLVFAAAGLSMMFGLFIDRLATRNKNQAIVLGTILVVTSLFGLRSVYTQATHRMDVVMQFVSKNYQPTDAVVSAELYTYFDSSFYNTTKTVELLYTPTNADGTLNHPNGFGESGLLYDKNVYLDSYRDIPQTAERVWVVGKTGDHAYWDQIPLYWNLISTKTSSSSEVRLYQVQ